FCRAPEESAHRAGAWSCGHSFLLLEFSRFAGDMELRVRQDFCEGAVRGGEEGVQDCRGREARSNQTRCKSGRGKKIDFDLALAANAQHSRLADVRVVGTSASF